MSDSRPTGSTRRGSSASDTSPRDAQGGAARPRFTDQEALQFHSQGKPGKLEITPTKPMATQRDLSLAYSPGVAVPVRAIAMILRWPMTTPIAAISSR
jgi:malic enzyme